MGLQLSLQELDLCFGLSFDEAFIQLLVYSVIIDDLDADCQGYGGIISDDIFENFGAGNLEDLVMV